MPMMIRGSECSSLLQNQIRATYVHRYTGDNTPQWARTKRHDGSEYPLQFKDDADWLANTFFPITKKGKLARRPSHCESHPTWPDNPELRGDV